MSDRDTYREILTQWEQVEKDRAYAGECLNRTGPGESPYSKAMSEAWTAREEGLRRTVVAAIPEIIRALDGAINGCQCLCHKHPEHPQLQDALNGIEFQSRMIDELKQTIAGVRQGIISAENPTGDTDDVLDLLGVFIKHHKEKEALVKKFKEVLVRFASSKSWNTMHGASCWHTTQELPQQIAVEALQ